MIITRRRMSFSKTDLKQLDKALTLNNFKRQIKIAIEKNEQSSNKLPSNIVFAQSNILQHGAFTQLSTQNPDDMIYGIVSTGRSRDGNDVYLFRYMYTDENLNYNLYYVEIKKSIIIKIKYLDNFFFPKELIEIRKILSWKNNYILMDLSGIICGDYGDTEMFQYNVAYGCKFSNTEGLLPAPNGKNIG
jgi:hypothetical protein